jgi:hypothetical protein
MFSENHELNQQERAAIAALPRQLTPSDLLEERVVRALRHEGHFATRASRHWARPLTSVAAAVALFAGGVLTGRYALSQQETGRQAAKQTAPVNQAIGSNPAPDNPVGTQTVKNGKAVVAEREMWL